MNAKDRVESDLRSFGTSGLPSPVKKLIDQVIFNIRSNNSRILISDNKDPFLSAFVLLIRDKKTEPQAVKLISILSTLVSLNSIDGPACQTIFLEITRFLPVASESFLMKILQISNVVFLCNFDGPFTDFDPHNETLRWIFSLSHSQSSLISQVAKATAVQIVDTIFDQITISSNESLEVKEKDDNIDTTSDNGSLYNHSSSTDSLDSSLSVINPTHWTVSFIFELISSLLSGRSKYSDSIPLLRHIFDDHLQTLRAYSDKFIQMGKLFISYIFSQKSISAFNTFVPHAVLYFRFQFQSDILSILQRLISNLPNLKDLPKLLPPPSKDQKKGTENFDSQLQVLCSILSTFSAIVTIEPDLMYSLISEKDLIAFTKVASSFIISQFQGSLSRSISFIGSNPMKLSLFNPNPSRSECIVSSIELLFSEITISKANHPELFKAIFEDFEGAWIRVVQVVDDIPTLTASLQVARTAVCVGITIHSWDSVQRIIATLCGIAFPPSSKASLNPKCVLTLHTILRLLQKFGKLVEKFWPQMIETISKCHHCATHSRSSSDAQALKIIDARPMEWTTKLTTESLYTLFSCLLKLSEDEYRSYSESAKSNDQDVIPNFWPLQTLSIVFGLNLNKIAIPLSSISDHKSNTIEALFFGHLKKVLQCQSPQFRMQAGDCVFEITKDVLSAQETQKSTLDNVFAFIFEAANSSYKEVSSAAFSSINSLLTGGIAEKIGDGWQMVLTVLKVVWTQSFPDNHQTGFRALKFICSDCLNMLKLEDIEICVSTISRYISQDDDINIALGAIELYWSVGTQLLDQSMYPNSRLEDKIDVWKALLSNLHYNITDQRQNIRTSSLQTLFSLINTFHTQFPKSFCEYIISNEIIPLVVSVEAEAKSDLKILSIESSVLSLQGAIQSLQSLKKEVNSNKIEDVVIRLISAIEALDLRKEISSSTDPVTKLYQLIIDLGDSIEGYKEMFLELVTNSFSRVINTFLVWDNTNVLQGAIPVLTTIFSKVVTYPNNEIFEKWLTIFNLCCRFQADKGKNFLPVSTHVCMNMLSNLPLLEESRGQKIMQILIDIVEWNLQQPPSLLGQKILENIPIVFASIFDEKGRGSALTIILPILNKIMSSKNILQNDGKKCFSKLLESANDIDPCLLLNNKECVLILIDITRRNSDFEDPIVTLLSRRMDLIPESTFNAFMSLTYYHPSIYISFYSICCQNHNSDSLIAFAKKVAPIMRDSVSRQVDLILNEEKVRGCELSQKRYSGLISLLKTMNQIETNPSIFLSNSLKGHIHFNQKCLLKLTSSLNTALSDEARNLLTITFSNE